MKQACGLYVSLLRACILPRPGASAWALSSAALIASLVSCAVSVQKNTFSSLVYDSLLNAQGVRTLLLYSVHDMPQQPGG